MLKIIDNEFIWNKLKIKGDCSVFPEDVIRTVRGIIKQIANKGDAAVRDYMVMFDKVDYDMSFKVTSEEIEEGHNAVAPEIRAALKAAIENIRAFHMNQKEEGWYMTTSNNSVLGNIITPMDRVAVYVPGGTAAYPSSVIMNVVPAQIAGVKDIVIFTPPNRNGTINKYVAAAAYELGIDQVYRIGGAQAVAAAALGTETINRVDKIVGPGNIYVAAAKKEVYGIVDIDMIAGPSEILVIADDTARPDYIAADLMSQAEHDELAKCILVTDSRPLAEQVLAEIEKRLDNMSRKEIIKASLCSTSSVFIVKDMNEAAEIANYVAPEHLEIMVKQPSVLLQTIKNAGAIFVGNYSTEPIGDYIAGPNHVLPTNGTARFSSPLTVKDFKKTSSYICYSKEDFNKYAPEAIIIAKAEGLTAHAGALEVRLKND